MKNKQPFPYETLNSQVYAIKLSENLHKLGISICSLFTVEVSLVQTIYIPKWPYVKKEVKKFRKVWGENPWNFYNKLMDWWDDLEFDWW